MKHSNRSSSKSQVVAIVQARLGSVRMPKKVLAEVLGKPLLYHLVSRLSRAVTVDRVVLAIPSSGVNDSLEVLARELGISCVRGSELDVLERFVAVAELFPADAYVRITGDCPLVAPDIVDDVVNEFFRRGADYGRTNLSFPDGLDVEVFTSQKLYEAAEGARDYYDREHVTPFIHEAAGSKIVEVAPARDLSRLRMTIDEPEDLTVIQSIFREFGNNEFSLVDITSLAEAKPELFIPNQHMSRNFGSNMGSGEKLWTRAKRVIPGGNHLLSKRSEMHLPVGWPAYFSRTSGCQVWDLDGKRYLDVGYMGVGTNILGYSNPIVDEAVRSVIADGNLSTLNCPEEVYLAERLCELHPWADMARFTRTGGEAATVAVRIARAASGKDGVAICGYHGWHDWYLSANLSDEGALDGHLLTGLEPKGVPRSLRGSVQSFSYNDLGALRQILEQGNVGTVFMEVERSVPPAPGFLEAVRALASKHGAVLVFDECTSGFRRVLGGLHLHYGVEPDIAIFGKTLGNGYAINAVIGRESVMQSAQATFISSTFWSERIGPTAALATLDVMQDTNAPERVHAIGESVRASWSEIAEARKIQMNIGGIPALNVFSLPGYDSAEVKTFLTGEMLSDGFLASTALYASLSHTPEVLGAYFESFAQTIAKIGNHRPDSLKDSLPHGVAQSGFQRLN